MDEAEFRQGIRDRDPLAWERLDRQYGPVLRRQASFMLPPCQDPENAVGEVWLRAITQAHRYKPAYPPYFWLARICTNTCLNQRRHFRRFLSNLLRWSRLEARAKPGPFPTEAREAVHTALGKLTRRQQEVMMMRYLFGFAVPEVATVLKTSINSVHQTRRRAINHLRTGAAAPELLSWLTALEREG